MSKEASKIKENSTHLGKQISKINYSMSVEKAPQKGKKTNAYQKWGKRHKKKFKQSFNSNEGARSGQPTNPHSHQEMKQSSKYNLEVESDLPKEKTLGVSNSINSDLGSQKLSNCKTNTKNTRKLKNLNSYLPNLDSSVSNLKNKSISINKTDGKGNRGRKKVYKEKSPIHFKDKHSPSSNNYGLPDIRLSGFKKRKSEDIFVGKPHANKRDQNSDRNKNNSHTSMNKKHKINKRGIKKEFMCYGEQQDKPPKVKKDTSLPPPLKTRGLDIAPREKAVNYEEGINLSKPEMSRSKMMSEQELLNYIFSSRNNINGMPKINLDSSSVSKMESYQFRIPNLDVKELSDSSSLTKNKIDKHNAVIQNLSLKGSRNRMIDGNEPNSFQDILTDNSNASKDKKNQLLSFEKISTSDMSDYYKALKSNFGYCKNLKKLISHDSKNKMLERLLNKHKKAERLKSNNTHSTVMSRPKEDPMFGLDLKEDHVMNKENRKFDKKNRNKSNAIAKNPDAATKLKKIKGMISCNRSHEDMLSGHVDEEIEKLDRLALINASARFDLLSANKQLLSFKLNNIIKNKDSQYQENQKNGGRPLRVDTADGDVNAEQRKQKAQNPVKIIQNSIADVSRLV
ncbi:unnamed protein product [Moneuplotes crassus]|uniref:Uncharacterized protein n=1 Tax=Euplotes crassus TaxID=5936 RepID=A0AAD1TZ71_EUPCR|nr:unnamed protein product [Moneuplotes crassus]